MPLDGHLGRTVGFSAGISTPGRTFDFGMRYYGRRGPINEHQEYELALSAGQTYKGKEVQYLGADHGYIGLEAAYNLPLANDR